MFIDCSAPGGRREITVRQTEVVETTIKLGTVYFLKIF
jgi:hypothetical protein